MNPAKILREDAKRRAARDAADVAALRAAANRWSIPSGSVRSDESRILDRGAARRLGAVTALNVRVSEPWRQSQKVSGGRSRKRRTALPEPTVPTATYADRLARFGSVGQDYAE